MRYEIALTTDFRNFGQTIYRTDDILAARNEMARVAFLGVCLIDLDRDLIDFGMGFGVGAN